MTTGAEPPRPESQRPEELDGFDSFSEPIRRDRDNVGILTHENIAVEGGPRGRVP